MNRYTAAREWQLLTQLDVANRIGRENLELLKDRYNAPGRFYHNWDHVLDVLTAVNGLCLEGTSECVHVLAALFHDAIYTVGAATNEAHSAALMVDTLGWDSYTARASDLILATAKHMTASTESMPPEHRDFMDCDLLGLASEDWNNVVAQDWAVGKEQLAAGWSEPIISVRRHNFFTSMLSKPTIFLGKRYGSSCEWQARMNMWKLLSINHDYSLKTSDLMKALLPHTEIVPDEHT